MKKRTKRLLALGLIIFCYTSGFSQKLKVNREAGGKQSPGYHFLYNAEIDKVKQKLPPVNTIGITDENRSGVHTSAGLRHFLHYIGSFHL